MSKSEPSIPVTKPANKRPGGFTLRRGLVFGGLGALGLGFFQCTFGENENVLTYLWRLTVEIETRDGLRRGSGVFETQLVNDHNSTWMLHSARLFHQTLRGEAFAIDLADGRTVFVLLDTSAVSMGNNFTHILPAAMGLNPWDPKVVLPGLYRELEAPKPRAVPLMHQPTLVMFRDTKDPGSLVVLRAVRRFEVRVVEQEGRVVVDRLEDMLGEGARIARVEVEAVRGSGVKRIRLQSKAPPERITQQLPWLVDDKQGTKIMLAIREETDRQVGGSGLYLFWRP